MFSLLIIELPLNGHLRSAVKGPWLFPSEFAAENALFRYVVNHVLVTCLDDFLEAAPSLNLPDWACSLDLDKKSKVMKAEAAGQEDPLNGLNRDERQRVINWYFNLISGNLREAYFSIKVHVRPYDLNTDA